METSREDVGIVIRSAFLNKGTKQKFSLLVLIVLSVILIFLETAKVKPLNYFRNFVNDIIYRGSLIVSMPSKSFVAAYNKTQEHITLYENYHLLKKENTDLKNEISNSDYLELENTMLRQLIGEKVASPSIIESAKVMLDKQSPYLNSFIINIGSNKKIKNGMAVLDGKNFIGRTVDVNFFSSRVLLISDLNSQIPIISEPSGNHAILRGHGENKLSLKYLPENHSIKHGDKIFTSGKEGIFSSGIPIGEVQVENDNFYVLPFSDLSQVNYINIKIKNNN